MRALHLFDSVQFNSTRRIVLFAFPLFFILLSDSIMSYMFPILVATTTQSNTMLGIIMALSSVLGIACDFSFPQLLRNRSWRFQLTVGIILAVLFPIFSNLGSVFSLILFFVLATFIWGVYFEFLQFSQQSFVTGEDSPKQYSKDWGILYLIYEITLNVGPIIGSILLTQHVLTANLTVNSFQIISLLFALIVISKLPSKSTIKPKSHIASTIHLFKELSVWKTLGERVWPVVLSGITISFINATYWTIGGLLGREIMGETGNDWIVMVLFGIPLIVGSVLLTRITITSGKKRFTSLSLLTGGLLLACVFLVKAQPIFVLVIIVLSSFCLAFAGPLNEAVYSDLLFRSGKNKLHLLGIAKANTSFAYIIAPLFVGWMSDVTDYYNTLSLVGVVSFIVGLLLLVTSPKKIQLPSVNTIT